MWSKAQITAFQRSLAACQAEDVAIARLAEIAQHSPAFRDRVNDLIALHEQAKTLATVALSGATGGESGADPHACSTCAGR